MNNSINIKLQGLNCANCAAKIEEKVNNLNFVDEAILNFINKEIKIKLKQSADKKSVLYEVEKIVEQIEPDVKVCEKTSEVAEELDENENFIKKSAIRFILGAILFASAIFLKGNSVLSLGLFIVSYVIFGADVVFKAFRNITKGEVFDENFLMSIATIGAFIIGEYPEAVAVMLFYQIGEFFQDLAVNKSRKSIKKLMDIKPEIANLVLNGTVETISPENVSIDDIILIKPGEKIPLDGIVIEGNSSVDLSALIGESIPRNFGVGDEVLSGAINKTGVLKVKVTKSYSQSTVSKILELVENASSKKSSTENFITKFAKIYTPIVVLGAVILAVAPPLLTADFNFSVWFSRALVFLVSSCPCALVVSVPLGFFSGIGSASKNGVLIKGSNYLQALSETDSIVFDKTGTLTKGIFEVSNIFSKEIKENELLKYAYSLEKFSNHPVAKSIVEKYKTISNDDGYKISDFEEIEGLGLKGYIDNKCLLIGNNKLMKKESIEHMSCDSIGTVAYIAFDNKFLGYIVVEDKIKETSKIAVQNLKNNGIKNTTMLTGDRKITAEKIGKELNIDNVYSELLPQDKVSKIEDMFSQNVYNKIAFVGDGINDAPVLSRADIGIAMGGIGSDAAIEAADVVIMNDDINKISDAITISKNTLKIVKQNVYFVLAVKFIVLAMAVFGYASMWLAVFADVGVALISILNSMKKKL